MDVISWGTENSFKDIQYEDSPQQEEIRPKKEIFSSKRKSVPYYEKIVNNCSYLLNNNLDKRKENLIDYEKYKKRALSSNSKYKKKSAKVKITQIIKLIPLEYNCEVNRSLKMRLHEVLKGKIWSKESKIAVNLEPSQRAFITVRIFY